MKALEILERLGEHSLVQEIASKYEVTNFGNPAWTDPLLASNPATHHNEPQKHTAEHAHGCGCSHHEQNKPK
jgi:hypothetical protein